MCLCPILLHLSVYFYKRTPHSSMHPSTSKASLEEGRHRAVSVRKSRAASMIQDETLHSIPEVDVVAASSSFKLPKNIWPLIPVLIYMFLAALSPWIVDPTLPGIRKAYFGDSTKAALWSGIFESFFSFVGLFTGGMFGRLSDSHGRWVVLGLNAFMITTPLALHCIFMKSTVWPFLATQFVVYAFGSTPMGNPALGFSIVSDLFEPFERLIPLSLFVTSFFLGMSGSAIPSIFHLDNQQIAIVGVCLAASAQLFAFFGVKESLPVEKRNRLEIKELFQNPLVPLRFVYTSRYLRAFTALSFCLTLPLYVAMSINLYYLEDRIKGFGSSDNAMLLTSAGVSYIILSYTALPLGLKILSPPTLICIAAAVAVVNNILFFVIREKWQVFALLGPTMAMSFFTVPIVTQLVTSTLKPNERGIALGTMASVKGLANSIGPILGAAAYSVGTNQLGFRALPYCISLTVSVVGFLVALLIVRPVVNEMEDLVTLDDEEDTNVKPDGNVQAHQPSDSRPLLHSPSEEARTVCGDTDS